MICKICNNSKDNKEFQIKEMMFGTGDYFPYMECSNCGCLQIIEIPEEMGKYYPSDFYSFQFNENFIRKFIRTQRNRYAYSGKSIIGKMAYNKFPAYFFDKLKDIDLNSKILDVGCGSGKLINSLKSLGFINLMGIDPFLEKDIKEKNIFKKDIHELKDSDFDVIIFKDTIEHIEDQLGTLKKASSILSDNGKVIITMPVKTEYIWNKYGVDWVQIDAPRHFLIHTLKSFELMVNKTDLNIEKVIFDSNEFQFWGSEQNKRGITHLSPNSYLKNPKKSIFTGEEIKEFREKSKLLNEKKLGDHAFFVLG